MQYKKQAESFVKFYWLHFTCVFAHSFFVFQKIFKLTGIDNACFGLYHTGSRHTIHLFLYNHKKKKISSAAATAVFLLFVVIPICHISLQSSVNDSILPHWHFVSMYYLNTLQSTHLSKFYVNLSLSNFSCTRYEHIFIFIITYLRYFGEEKLFQVCECLFLSLTVFPLLDSQQFKYDN